MPGKSGLGRKLLLSSTLLATLGVGGGYFAYQQRLKTNRSVGAAEFNARQDQDALRAAFANLTDVQNHPLTRLYRYTTCPWCGTVKAFLDYNKIWHQCIEVDPMLKSQLAESAYKKVPQLRFDTADKAGPYLVDSRLIVDTLAQHLGYTKELTDTDINRWREWARGPLVRFVTLELNKSLVAAWRGYSYIDSCTTIPYINKLFLKVVGAPVMYIVAQKITKPRLIKDGFMQADDVPKECLHAELKRFAQEALVHPKTHKPLRFHGGDKPDLADLDAYGVLQSVRGHRLYNDIIRETELAPWLREMDKAVGNEVYVIPA